MKKLLSLTLAALLLLPLLGCSQEEAAPAANLAISLKAEHGLGFTTIPLEQGEFQNFVYLDVTDVNITLEGETMPLEEALQTGKLTVDEMVALARRDAEAGICNEFTRTENGLTQFVYRYKQPDFNFSYSYDVYETPDGGEHLIADAAIYGAGAESGLTPRGKQGEQIDREDWGLTFEVTQATPTSLTVTATQTGGQQIGQLVTDWGFVTKATPEGHDSLEATGGDHGPESEFPLTMEGTTQLTFDLGSRYDPLPAGDYTLVLQVIDEYEEEALTPMMRNFWDYQWYEIPFTVQ